MSTQEFRIAKLLRNVFDTTGVRLSLGTVESATGGRIADKITNVPGISDFYKGSIIAYSNEVKSEVVGVNQQTLSSKGAVSHKTAVEMAESGRTLLNVHICLSDTGIAGPSGGTKNKPVGLFYIGISTYDGILTATKFGFSGSRYKNKNAAVQSALMMLEKYLLDKIAKIQRGADAR